MESTKVINEEIVNRRKFPSQDEAIKNSALNSFTKESSITGYSEIFGFSKMNSPTASADVTSTNSIKMTTPSDHYQNNVIKTFRIMTSRVHEEYKAEDQSRLPESKFSNEIQPAQPHESADPGSIIERGILSTVVIRSDYPESQSEVGRSVDPESQSVVGRSDDPESQSVVNRSDDPESQSVVSRSDDPESPSVVSRSDDPESQSVVSRSDDPESQSVVSRFNDPESQSVVSRTDNSEDNNLLSLVANAAIWQQNDNELQNTIIDKTRHSGVLQTQDDKHQRPGGTLPQDGIPQQPGGTLPQARLPKYKDATIPKKDLLQQPGATLPQDGIPQQPGATQLQNSIPQQPGATQPQNGIPQQPGATQPQNGIPQQPGATLPQNGIPQQPGATVPTGGTPHHLVNFTSRIRTTDPNDHIISPPHDDVTTLSRTNVTSSTQQTAVQRVRLDYVTLPNGDNMPLQTATVMAGFNAPFEHSSSGTVYPLVGGCLLFLLVTLVIWQIFRCHKRKQHRKGLRIIWRTFENTYNFGSQATISFYQVRPNANVANNRSLSCGELELIIDRRASEKTMNEDGEYDDTYSMAYHPRASLEMFTLHNSWPNYNSVSSLPVDHATADDHDNMTSFHSPRVTSYEPQRFATSFLVENSASGSYVSMHYFPA